MSKIVAEVNKNIIKPARPSYKDLVYQSKAVTPKQKVDMREWDLGVEDQSSLGSCVGNAVATAYEILVKKEFPEKSTDLSRLFVYYNGRLLEGSEKIDDGVSVKSAVKSVFHYGVCNEKLWPYNITAFDNQPTPSCYRDAIGRRISKYQKVFDTTDMIGALDAGKPIVMGLYTFNGFSDLTKTDSIVKMPTDKDAYFGAHSMTIVGYDLDKKLFLAKNSYGAEWGDNGYCWIPFDYAKPYLFDKWIFDITDPYRSS